MRRRKNSVNSAAQLLFAAKMKLKSDNKYAFVPATEESLCVGSINLMTDADKGGTSEVPFQDKVMG